MSNFDRWWDDNKDGFAPTPLMEKCYEGGYDDGYADGAAAVRVLRYVVLGVLALAIAFVMAGCTDHYRYPCQDPSNWEKPECKPPVCIADGTCTKDLVTEAALVNPTKGTKK